MSSTKPPTASARTAWLAGLVLGALDGVLLLEFPLLGYVLVAAGLALLVRAAPWAAGSGGLLVGIGGVAVLLLLRVTLECDAFNAVPNQGCQAPGIEGWLVAYGLVLAGGVALTILAYGRRTRRATER